MIKRAVEIGVISCLVAVVSGSVSGAIANPSASRLVKETPAGSLIAQNHLAALMSGTFVAAEAPTTGTAQIVEDENGQRYLELDSSFSTTDQAPDLQVLLDPSETPPTQYGEAEAGQYVNLGSLQAFSGSQRYPIPDAIDPANYQSVVIWCRMANATMGYASLESGTPVGVK